MLGREARLPLKRRHLLSHHLGRLHTRDHLLDLIEVWLHNLLHHRMLLLVQHELLCLQLLLLELMKELLIVVLNFTALLLRNCNVGVLLKDLRELFDFHGLIEQGLLLLELLLHLLLGKLVLAIDRHCHAVGSLHLLEVLLLHLGEVSDLLVGKGLSLLNVLGDLGLLSFHLHVL